MSCSTREASLFWKDEQVEELQNIKLKYYIIILQSGYFALKFKYLTYIYDMFNFVIKQPIELKYWVTK